MNRAVSLNRIYLGQVGDGYPGSAGCNRVIPHAKWHVQVVFSGVPYCVHVHHRTDGGQPG